MEYISDVLEFVYVTIVRFVQTTIMHKNVLNRFLPKSINLLIKIYAIKIMISPNFPNSFKITLYLNIFIVTCNCV